MNRKKGLNYIENLQKALCVSCNDAGKLTRWYIDELGKSLRERRVKLDPLLLILAEDVLTHCVVVRMAHEVLNKDKEAIVAAHHLETVLKFREKLRKSINDLQASISAAGTAAGGGIAEVISQIGNQLELDAAESTAAAGGPLRGLRPDLQAVAPVTAGVPEADGSENVEPHE